MIRAYTLMETIIALVVSALISLGVASILQTAAYGTSSQRDIRRVVVQGEVVHERLDAAIRNSRAVLASGNGYVVLWTGDSNPDSHVNLSEMQLIEVPTGSTTLSAYSGVYTVGDPVYATSSNFYTVAQAAKAGSSFPRTTWATNISNLTFKLDNATPILSKLVTWSLTLTDQQLKQTIVSGALIGVPGQPR